MRKAKIAHFSSRVASASSQFLILLIVPVAFSIDDQGYYFLFSSVTALQYIFELGSTQVFAIKISAFTRAFRPDRLGSMKSNSNTESVLLKAVSTYGH